eukprot:jgi/Picsp_1/941/NSC_04426-R1_p-loop containing nucleoside triphosphate hydrolase protein
MDTIQRPPKEQGDLKGQHNASRKKIKEIKENFRSTKPLLLFDLNGVLVKHSYDALPEQVSKRHKFVVRPGIHHLARLHDIFNIGIYSSSTKSTVQMALREIEIHVKLNLCKILHRRDCVPATTSSGALKKATHAVTARQMKPWDTLKPLKNHFRDIRNIALIDDSPHKSFPGEEENMIVIPTFHPPFGSSDKDYYSGEGDGVIKLLVDSILSSFTGQKAFVDAIALVQTIFDRLNDFMAQEIWSTVIDIMGSGQPIHAHFAQDQPKDIHYQIILPGGERMGALLVCGSSQHSGEQTREWIWVRIVDIFIPDQVVLCEKISPQADLASKNSLEGMIGSLSLQ